MNKLKIVVTVALVFIMACISYPSSAQKKGYDMPKELPDSLKKKFVKDFKEGAILYKPHCSSCHNKIVNGKEEVPDFSLPQLMDYELRFYYVEHQKPLTEELLSETDLNKIIHYLRYKKKNIVEQK
jgi:hypothetical protein